MCSSFVLLMALEEGALTLYFFATYSANIVHMIPHIQ